MINNKTKKVTLIAASLVCITGLGIAFGLSAHNATTDGDCGFNGVYNGDLIALAEEGSQLTAEASTQVEESVFTPTVYGFVDVNYNYLLIISDVDDTSAYSALGYYYSVDGAAEIDKPTVTQDGKAVAYRNLKVKTDANGGMKTYSVSDLFGNVAEGETDNRAMNIMEIPYEPTSTYSVSAYLKPNDGEIKRYTAKTAGASVINGLQVSVSDADMRGMELTVKCENGEQVVTVDSDNRFSFDYDKKYTYSVSGKVAGVNTELGTISVNNGEAVYNPTSAFGAYSGTMDLANGNFSYTHAKNRLLTVTDSGNSIAQGDAWFAAKVSLSAADLEKLKSEENGEATFGTAMTVGGKTVYVDIWLKPGDNNRYGLRAGTWDQHNVFADKDGQLTNYGKALIGDGLYFILRYNSAEGWAETYLGTTLEDVKYLRDWGTTENESPNGMEKNSTVTSFSIGCHQNWGDTGVTVNFSDVKYGKTLGEALGVAENVTLSADSTVTGGNVTVTGERYGNVNIVPVPDGDNILYSLKVNGVDRTAEAINGSISLNMYGKPTVKVEAIFGENLLIERATVGVKQGVNMKGMALTLTAGEDVRNVTVSDDNTITLENVQKQTIYAVSGTVGGVKTALGNIMVSGESVAYDPSSVFGSYNGTLDLANGNFSYTHAQRRQLTVTDSGDSIAAGNAYVATRITLSEADVNTLMHVGGEATFGIALTVGGTTNYADLWLKWVDSNNFERQILMGSNNDDKHNAGKGLRSREDEIKNALTGGGLYIAVGYNAATGALEVYLGSSIDNVALLDVSWGTAPVFDANARMTAFSIGCHKNYGSTGVTVNFSNVKYGKTLDEALGK